MKDLFKVISLETAQHLVESLFKPKFAEVPLLDALGKILAEDLIAPEDLPHFRRSTVDGYAIYAEDTFGCSESLPAMLRLTGEVRMGEHTAQKLKKGETAYVATGAMLPDGADAVIMLEYCEQIGEEILCYRPVAPGENLLVVGEDAKEGSYILNKGCEIRAQEIAYLAALGFQKINVFLPPVMGIISTGDELVEIHKKPLPGQIRDANSYLLAAKAKQIGAAVRIYPLVEDNFETLLNTVKKATEETDIVLLSGGSSVGAKDETARVLSSLGQPGILAHGLAIKPGKPTLIAALGDIPLFGLPGHPVSAGVVFDILIRPALTKILRLRDRAAIQWAVISRNLASFSGRTDIIRVKLKKENETYIAEPVLGKSGLLSTLVQADGYILIPDYKEGLHANEMVEVILY